MAFGRVDRVSRLTRFSYERMYGRFAGEKRLAVVKR